VVFSQNHDQVGNRPRGERLAALVSFEAQKLAAAAVLLSPFIPLLFMGEEYGETTPFRYFVSHGSPELIRAVRAGRRAELRAVGWRGEPPDPQDNASFTSSKLNRILVTQPRHRILCSFYRKLIRLRRTLPALASASGGSMTVRAHESEQVLLVGYSHGGERVLMAFNCSDQLARLPAPAPPGRWFTLLNSASRRWGGPGSPLAEELCDRGKGKLLLAAKSVLVLGSRTPVLGRTSR